MYMGSRLLVVLEIALLTLLLLAGPSVAGNACEAEIASACPERPGSETAKCLKDKDEHDKPTEISSECTDFIAMNVACAADIAKFCDEVFFGDDTVLCLTVWTPRDNLDAKCAKVVEWAAPKKEEGEAGPTDELGLSDKDYAEKKKWQAERKAARDGAIDKMKEDQKEYDALAQMRKEDPEGYKRHMKEQEQAKRSFEELKKRNRLMAAAKEREQAEKDREERIAHGLPVEDLEVPEVEEEPEIDLQSDGKKPKAKKRRRVIKKSEPTGWLPIALGGVGAAFVLMNVVNFFTKDTKKEDEDKDD